MLRFSYAGDTIVMPPLYDKKALRSAKKEEPEFDKRVPNRVRAVKGDVASLQCAVKNVFNETVRRVLWSNYYIKIRSSNIARWRWFFACLKVSWIRHGDLQILTVDNYVFTGDDRVQITRDDANCWTLTIKRVRIRDAGIYECQISTQPIKSFAVNLVVGEDRYCEIATA